MKNENINQLYSTFVVNDGLSFFCILSNLGLLLKSFVLGDHLLHVLWCDPGLSLQHISKVLFPNVPLVIQIQRSNYIFVK